MGNLTGKEIVEKRIIYQVDGGIPEVNIAQHGVDLNLIKVQSFAKDEFTIDNDPEDWFEINCGAVLCDKTIVPTYRDIPTFGHVKPDGAMTRAWELTPGMYNITFEQGCNIPKDQRLFIVQRSSVMRNGAIINSSMFDAGFCTDNMGTFLCVFSTIIIEEGARVAQAYTEESNVVENLYNGQFQKDVQRK